MRNYAAALTLRTDSAAISFGGQFYFLREVELELEESKLGRVMSNDDWMNLSMASESLSSVCDAMESNAPEEKSGRHSTEHVLISSAASIK